MSRPGVTRATSCPRADSRFANSITTLLPPDRLRPDKTNVIRRCFDRTVSFKSAGREAKAPADPVRGSVSPEEVEMSGYRLLIRALIGGKCFTAPRA